jgi:putative membrane protein
MMGFVFVVARFGLFLRELAFAGNIAQAPYTGFSLWIGTGLILLGVGVNLLAALDHRRFLRRLNQRQAYVPPRWSLSIVVA